jgi:FMN phosphatase YigB (HAD superfamily)
VAIAVPKAIVFDTFGSVVDWRGSVIEQLAAFGERKGIRADWTELADAWRGEYGPSMDRVRRGEQPFVTLDELHHQSLAQLVSRRGIVGVTAEDLDELTLVWHHLRSPDLAAAQSYGLSTAFFPRPDEFGDPERARADLPAPGMSFDYLCQDIEDLAVQLGV